jgi:hypothetical protein
MEEMVQRVGHPSLLIDKNDVSELYEQGFSRLAATTLISTSSSVKKL